MLCGHTRLLNLWSGFAIAPAANPTARYGVFRDHLLTNVCGGDEAKFRWVFGFFAQIVQRPHEEADEGWLDDHHKREKRFLDEAISDGFDRYPDFDAINDLPPSSESRHCPRAGRPLQVRHGGDRVQGEVFTRAT
jgi:hypothetical protein